MTQITELAAPFGHRMVGRHKQTVTLYHADCVDVLPISCDAVVTDPPYGLNADKDNAHSSIRDNARWPESEWDKQRPPDAALRLLPTLSAVVAVWGGNYFADCFPPSGGWLIWKKPEAETGFSLADAELCWTSQNCAARMRSFARRDGNDHPTQKPVAVMAWTLDQLGVPQGRTIPCKFGPSDTWRNAVVLDPYMGSGTTGIACVRTGRDFIGIERDAAHYATARDRILKELDSMLL